MKKENLFFVMIFIIVVKISAQSNFEAGFLPKIIFSTKIDAKTKWVNSIESRTIVFDETYQFSHNLVDLSSIYSLKSGLNHSFNLGYILRFRGKETIHRTFQHYNFVSDFLSLKIGNRIAFEQFYQVDDNVTFRTRYQASVQKPLNGEKVDVKEFYLKLGNEYLTDFNDLEIRFTPYLGYQISKIDKLEFGLDYRVNDFITSTAQNNLWFRTTWYISL
ncbi:DUF2490 domain-containing protein [uncultured Polaribacter sp.]|uniref:DUF2490 domain-containing protein n=1 Tax=uncultured Polaribacter sp. TaxID=174711 RepID=UPI002604DCAF|nr:DUF2490 domain-containing protein [uncultured Polaribacter sp.]